MAAVEMRLTTPVFTVLKTNTKTLFLLPEKFTSLYKQFNTNEEVEA
jgi:hypothetical protein